MPHIVVQCYVGMRGYLKYRNRRQGRFHSIWAWVKKDDTDADSPAGIMQPSCLHCESITNSICANLYNQYSDGTISSYRRKIRQSSIYWPLIFDCSRLSANHAKLTVVSTFLCMHYQRAYDQMYYTNLGISHAMQVILGWNKSVKKIAKIRI